MINRAITLACALLLGISANHGVAASDTPDLQSFNASYHLSVSGWPDADINHRLTQVGPDRWRASMKARIAIARGMETGHFRLSSGDMDSYDYDSNYRLLGIARDYTLDSSKLGQIPDRQSAIIGLAMNAANSPCQHECPLHYRDHRGRDKTLLYQRLPDAPMQVAGMSTQALRLELSEPDEPEKRMLMSMHPDVPGLMLEMEYFRDGKRKSRLSLTSVDHF